MLQVPLTPLCTALGTWTRIVGKSPQVQGCQKEQLGVGKPQPTDKEQDTERHSPSLQAATVQCRTHARTTKYGNDSLTHYSLGMYSEIRTALPPNQTAYKQGDAQLT